MSRPLSPVARSAIVDATVALLAECSIREVTIDAVAARSGVAKTTIYRHFESRDEVLATALRATLAAFPEPIHTGDLDSDLLAWAQPLVDSAPMICAPRAAMEFFAEVVSSPVLAGVHDEMIEEVRGSLVDLLTEARDRGELRPEVDVQLCADAIVGPIIVRRLRDAPLGECDVAALFGYVLDGVRTRP
jgi:AcrR family transcriptional regulator